MALEQARKALRLVIEGRRPYLALAIESFFPADPQTAEILARVARENPQS